MIIDYMKGSKVKLFKHQMLITGISVFALVVSMVGGSYALFTASDRGEYNVITVGNLDISYVDTGNGYGDVLSLNGAYPISDVEGKKLAPYRFNIENKGNTAIDFKIKLVNDESIIETDGCGNNLLPFSYIKYQFDNEEPVLLSSKESSGYTIYSESNLLGKSSQIHEVRVWITDEASGNLNNVLGKHFHGKVVVETSQSGVDEKLKTAYSAGNRVILKDGSSWHVLKESSKSMSTVTLLSDYNLRVDEGHEGEYDTGCNSKICSPIMFDQSNIRNGSYCSNSINGCNIYSKNGNTVLADSYIKTWLETNYVGKLKTSLTSSNGGTAEGLSVTLPNMEDIVKADGKVFNQTILSSNISNSYLITTNYWTKTSSNTNTSYVWYVSGSDDNIAVEYANNDSKVGIRPVITTSKLNIETVTR